MLKTMTAMLDNYDTQMTDYISDIDMQVQAFSTEPWLHEEVSMEEDAPSLKVDNFTQVKDDGHDPRNLTIEVDMEEHNTNEYDMVDDEQLLQPPETLDVDLYDAPLAHMGFDSVLPAESTFSSVTVPPTESLETGAPVSESTLPPELVEESAAPPVLAEENVSDLQAPSPTNETSNIVFSNQESVSQEPFSNSNSDESVRFVDPGTAQTEERTQEEVLGSTLPELQSHSAEETYSTVDVPDEIQPVGDVESLEPLDTSALPVESTSSGDPHEISEGVYIDPPPAVLLTISSDDHEHEFSLFNEPLEWQSVSTEQRDEEHHILLHHLPTLYYEPLFSLFEALRQDGFIQSTFHLHEVELVLHAVDLALTITEDNIYSREISLHDLNILHDGSELNGPLKTRLYASNPRFIIQYQQLQLAHQSRVSFGGHAETHESHTRTTEPNEPVTDPSEPPVTEEIEEKGDESGETQTSPSQQSQQAEEITESTREGEDEDEQSSGQAAENQEPDSLDHEQEPTNSHSTVENNYQDPENTPVIGLDLLEAAVDPQLDDDSLGASTDVHDSADGVEVEAGNEELEGGYQDVTQDDVSQGADGKYEWDPEAEYEEDEQGEEISHGYSESVDDEAESEPLPDQFQTLPKDDEEQDNQTEANVTKIGDDEQPFNGADGQEYNEELLPELPADDDNWEEQFEETENLDESWNDENNNENSVSAHSSVTLSSVTLSNRGSKRPYDEYESGGEGYEKEDQQSEIPESPNSKRTRIQ